MIVGYIIFDNPSQNATPTETATSSTSTAVEDSEGYGCFDVVVENSYDIPAQRFDETAQQIAHATDCFIQADVSQIGAVMVNPVQGEVSIRDAVAMAIENTDLVITEESADQIVVEMQD